MSVLEKHAPSAVETPAPGHRLPQLEYRWAPRRASIEVEQAAAQLERSLRLPLPLCRLLVLRGQVVESDARLFLKPRLEGLPDPHGLAGMDAAVERLARALDRGEHILVHGDYDVDGICGAALYTRVLRRLGARVTPFVPHRLRDGYDLTEAGVRAATLAGATLILTADCGTAAHEAVGAASSMGIDVIVTDHHSPGATLPPAAAVVNPNRPDCAYPNKGLAGAGVAYKLCEALGAARGLETRELWYYLDMVAVATIADLAPLRGENRVLARYGLRVLAETRNPGLHALLRATRIDPAHGITAGQVGHVLAPRINAVGRMGDAARGVRLLLEEDVNEAARLAAEMEAENERRRTVDRATLRHALEMLDADYDPARDAGVVLAAEGWHPGVIGIVASRVVERIHRPTVLIAIDGTTGRARGSARSIRGFHLYEAVRDCAHLLERYGGHRQAAGMDVRPDRVDAFRDAFNARAHAVLSPEALTPELAIDLEVRLPEITTELFALLRHFGPFGLGNPAPVMVARGVRLARPPREVGTGHVKLELQQERTRLGAIGFGMAERVARLGLADGTVDVAFHLQDNRYDDRLQARLLDVRPSA